jgi:xanthine dehydrogenase large subunit
LRERLSQVAAPILASDDPTCIRFQNRRVFDERHPTRALTFAQIVCQAHEQRVNLGERGFYATPVGEFDRAAGKGSPFLYFTNGVACAEVSIDRFTGETSVSRVDLLMDLGKSINPGIDRGQIIGGFVQGMGWCTTEELMYDRAGNLLSHSPTTYKIPNISDMPRTFNVDFLDNPNNQISIHKSKAVGEPPLLLGICVWLAIKDAVTRHARQTVFLPLPATGERVLMALAWRKQNSQLPV